jgi:hypothetical protein
MKTNRRIRKILDKKAAPAILAGAVFCNLNSNLQLFHLFCYKLCNLSAQGRNYRKADCLA